jgi:hypothetical protein
MNKNMGIKGSVDRKGEVQLFGFVVIFLPFTLFKLFLPYYFEENESVVR